LKEARQMIRHGQFRWDYVSANNGMGIHSPQECMRVLGDAINQAQEARVLTARRCSEKGVTFLPKYPAYETRQEATEIVKAFAGGAGVPLNK
jgi:nitrite reductase (cytochrome c-552)